MRCLRGYLALLTTCVALGIGAPATFALQLPDAVLAPARAQVASAEADLQQQRAQLATAVQAEQRAVANQQVLVAKAERVDAVLSLVPGFALDADSPMRVATTTVTADVQSTRTKLESVTERAATAQGRALDASRRLRALQRAADQDPAELTRGGIGYRFGSGGQPVSAASLDRYLESKASPMAGAGAALLTAGVEHRIDPRLLVAIAGAESYFGLITCAPFNGWGWGCPNGPYRFTSWADGIDTIARGLRENYLDDGLTTVGEIHLRYAPPNATNDPTNLNYGWADNVARFLVEQGGDPQGLEGPLAPSR